MGFLNRVLVRAILHRNHDYCARVYNQRVRLLLRESVLFDLIRDVRRSYSFTLSKVCYCSGDIFNACTIFDDTPFGLRGLYVFYLSLLRPSNFKAETSSSVKESVSSFLCS